jgi:hypothetical protein
MAEPKFSWPALPESVSEFEALMQAMDKTLAEKKLKPFQRSLHVPVLLWEAFGWSGPVFPSKEIASLPGFEGQVLLAKAYQWYDQCYGERLKSDMAYGHFPVRLGNSIWRVRAGVVWGQVDFFIDQNLGNAGISRVAKGSRPTANMLCQVEGLPQGLASRLTATEMQEFTALFLRALQSLIWRGGLRGKLFDIARSDYDASTSDLIAGRFVQARWGAQQAVEKTIKGLLEAGKTSYSKAGPNGHNLKYLAGLLATHHGIALSPALMDPAAVSAGVRYGDELSIEEQALRANHAALTVLDELRINPKTDSLLNQQGNAPSAP